MKQLEKGKILPLIFRPTLLAVRAQLITFLHNIVDQMYVSTIQEFGIESHMARQSFKAT